MFSHRLQNGRQVEIGDSFVQRPSRGRRQARSCSCQVSLALQLGHSKNNPQVCQQLYFFGVELAANLSMFRVSSRFIHFVVLAQLHKGSVTCSLPPKALKRGQPKACKATLEEHAGTPFGPERARADQEVASGEAPEPAACQDCHPPTSESASSSYPRTCNLKDFEIESRKGYKLFVFY